MVVIAAFMVGSVTGQTVKKTKEFITASDWMKAKDAIEQTFANPKLKKEEQAEAWYLKAKIYSAFATTATLKASAPADARNIALESVKKAIELDKNQAQVVLHHLY